LFDIVVYVNHFNIVDANSEQYKKFFFSSCTTNTFMLHLLATKPSICLKGGFVSPHEAKCLFWKNEEGKK
jgi:hypothetical protein